MEWLLQNKTWVFSGIGVFFLSIAFGLYVKRTYTNKIVQKQKSGKNSINYQVNTVSSRKNGK